jgi:hypothetical protein
MCFGGSNCRPLGWTRQPVANLVDLEPQRRTESAMRRTLVLLAALTLLGAADAPGVYYVTTDRTDERLAPSPSARSTNGIYRQQKVDVFEVRNGWARVSKFYDGSVEGVSGEVARWVLAAHLGKQRPADLPQPKIDRDPRIAKDAIGGVGDFGMTEADVRILYRGAKHFLDTGRCKRVELGMKSGSKPNTYFLNCGEPQNVFFTPADLPAE